MARVFERFSNEHLQVDSTPITVAPFSMAVWIYPKDVANSQTIMFNGDKDVADNYWRLHLQGNVAGDPIRFRAQDTSGSYAQTSTGVTANTWHHICGVESASNSRAVLIDGGSKGTNATTRTPDNADRITLGRLGASSPGAPYSGWMFWAAMWDAALVDAEVTSLAAGFHPFMVRPGNLKFFAPMGGLETAETDGGNSRDIVGGLTLTAVSDAVGPGIADHRGGLVYPSSPQIVIPLAAAAAGHAAPLVNSLRLKSKLKGLAA